MFGKNNVLCPYDLFVTDRTLEITNLIVDSSWFCHSILIISALKSITILPTLGDYRSLAFTSTSFPWLVGGWLEALGAYTSTLFSPRGTLLL